MSNHKYLYLLLFFSFNFFHLFFLVGGYLLYNIVVGFVTYLFIWLHQVFAGAGRIVTVSYGSFVAAHRLSSSGTWA